MGQTLAMASSLFSRHATYEFQRLPSGRLQMNLLDKRADMNLARVRKRDIHPVWLLSGEPMQLIQTNTNNSECSSDKRIACVYVRVSAKPKYTLLCSHGGTTDLGDHINYYFTLGQLLDCNVIGYDYAGFGISGGSLSEKRLMQDAETVYRYAVTSLKIRPQQLILHGQSLGTVASLHLASKFRVAGLVLISPFLRLPNAAKAAFFKEHSIEKVEQVQSPLLIIHGMEDDLTPLNQAQEIYETCNNPVRPLFIPNIGHWKIELEEELLNRLKTFVKTEAC